MLLYIEGDLLACTQKESVSIHELRIRVRDHKKDMFSRRKGYVFHFEVLTTVSIKDSEERDAAAQVRLGDMRVLHGSAPALHAHGAEPDLVVAAGFGVLLAVGS